MRSAVYKGDFLDLKVHVHVEAEMTLETPSEAPSPQTRLDLLAAGSFDVVVFSLLLSYIPSPERRAEAVWKARRLLRVGGLLLVVTPHSTIRKSNSSHHPILREWREAFGQMALTFVKTEKLKVSRQIALAYKAVDLVPGQPKLLPVRIAFDLRH